MSRWDVFCRVIDNYGDAGVCWRLARQLAAEHGRDVTLWIDRFATLAQIAPSLDVAKRTQRLEDVTVRDLDDVEAPALPDVVVEGFGCGLPKQYLDAMAKADPPPLWFNLEYLSAEPWVDAAHGLASPLPCLPLTRYFWFPGFTPKTGGLIREAGLFAARDAWQASQAHDAGTLRVLLFCYPNRALPALFDVWAEGDEPVACTIPEGTATAALDAWLQGAVPHPGESITHGRLSLDIVPFTTQNGFDRMLWSAHVNFVRGEDSFVRAQWAGRPLVWQPYAQTDDAHRLKLDAFVDRYGHGLAGSAQAPLRAFWQAFNDEDGPAAAAAWPAFRATLPTLEAHARRWADGLATLPDLSNGMVEIEQRRL